MEDLYNFNQHTHHICILIEKTVATFKTFKTLYHDNYDNSNLSEATEIIYNKEKTHVLSWGSTWFKSDNNCVAYDDFMNRLYLLFKKGKLNWNEDDIFFTEAMSQFLKLATEKLMSERTMKGYVADLDAFHYALIVPSEWEIEIQEELIRPIFIKANFISKNDHKDRLLFLTDLESISYSAQKDKVIQNDVLCKFEREQNTVMFRCGFTDKETALIKIDVLKSANVLFDIPDSNLFPKITLSDSLSFTSTSIMYGIKMYLKNNLFPNKKDTGQKKNIDMIVDYIYKKRIYQNYDSAAIVKEWEEKEDHQLNNSQKMFLNSIHPMDMLPLIGEDFHEKIKLMILENSAKNYVILLLEHRFSLSITDIRIPLLTWVTYILQYNFSILNNIKRLHIRNAPWKYSNEKSAYNSKLDDDIIQLDLERFMFSIMNQKNMISGISKFTVENIRNSNMYCTPRIIPNENQITSSIFKNSKPNVIINIDISFKSTLLSYSDLNEKGLIVKILDHNYFTAKKCLPSLETFYNINTGKAVLKTNKQFILFAEKYLWGDIESLCADEDFLFQIEAILNEEQFTKCRQITIYQPNYIRAFLLMYFAYIKNIISSKIPAPKNSERDVVSKTGYSIIIEKMLLDVIIGNKEEFADLIYGSGLLSKKDESKKLRIITKGEEVLSLIQPLLRLEFPVRSYFVLAQLHESYVQLTLNQVVTAFSLEGSPQEAIIMEDKFIAISNIYDSLGQNMWNNLIQNSNLIQLCNFHNENKVFELFSLTTKMEFLTNYRKYISEHILASDSDLRNFGKTFVEMNHSCNCKINLTINDVIEISFKPFLKEITSVCMGSLINKNIFGEYRNIDYHFSLIHFNQNLQFLDIITDIFKQEYKEFNPEQGIDTECIVIPKLPSQFFQMNLNDQPYLYKGFVIGTLHQIYTENYAVRIFMAREIETEIYTGGRIGKDTVSYENNGYFSLFKKGDIISNKDVVKLFYLLPCSLDEYRVLFDFRYNTHGDLRYDGVFSLVNRTWNKTTILGLSFNGFSKCLDLPLLPVIVTFKPPGHFSSPRIIIRKVGENAEQHNCIERAYSMTLSRF